MKERFNDFYKAYKFLENHKMTRTEIKLKNSSDVYEANMFRECLDVCVTKVNPNTGITEYKQDRFHLNTKTEVWLEFGGWNSASNKPCHDIDLDCGGDTFEEAIVNLANLVNIHYDEETGNKKE